MAVGLARSSLQLASVFILAALPSAAQGHLDVLISGGFSAAYQRLLPEFEKTSGIKVTTRSGPSQGPGADTIPAQLRRGVPADIVIMSKEGLRALIAEKRIAQGTVVDLAEAPLGVAVRAGAPKPDISTVEGFKQMVLRAKSINLPSTPAVYAKERLFPKLGIPESVWTKIDGSHSVAGLANGDFEIAIRPASEIMNVAGVDFVGEVPEEIQFVSIFSGAVVRGSKEVRAAKGLIGFLGSAKAEGAIRSSGMKALRAR